MRRSTILMIFSTILLTLSIAESQVQSCSAVYESAIDTIDQLCNSVERNQACYGHPQLSAESQPDVETFAFASPGDIEDVLKIKSLELAGYDEEAEIYGMAMMLLQANLPGSLPGTNVTILLFGENTIESVETPPTEISATISASGTINVRAEPSTNGQLATTLPSETELVANGRNEASDWVRVVLPEGGNGWIADFLLDIEGNINELEVVEGTEVMGAFQAVYLKTGIGQSSCETLPDDGILIQTPSGMGEIQFTINEVNVTLGSTAYITSVPGDVMTITLLTGQATVSAFDETVYVPRGAFTTIALDDEGIASGQPSYPEGYNRDSLTQLPIDILPNTVLIRSPAEETLIDRENSCSLILSGQVNVREGPGAAYATIDTYSASRSPVAIGQATDSNDYIWYQLTPVFSATGSYERWIRSDFVTLGDNCEDIPEVAAEDVPAIATAVPLSNVLRHVDIKPCGNPTHPAGITILVSFGQAKDTAAMAQADAAAGLSRILLNGVDVPVTHKTNPGPGYNTDYYWNPTEPGQYTFTGISDGIQDAVWTISCVITIE